MVSILARSTSRDSTRPASIMPSIAASTAAAFIFMKSTSVLSRSNTIARINGPPGARHCVRARAAPRPAVQSLGRDADRAADADLAVVDADVEPALGIAAD